tara:strand:- start:157 stop:432 length:276 start_codon:yes stop_codon:yes gene_type:complete
MAMLEEYTERFGKVHKCNSVLEKCIELYNPLLFDKHEATSPAMAMPAHFQSDDIVESYRKYYASKPRMRYPKDKVPDWFVKYRGKQEYQLI